MPLWPPIKVQVKKRPPGAFVARAFRPGVAAVEPRRGPVLHCPQRHGPHTPFLWQELKKGLWLGIMAPLN